jgi:lysophospholipase L1-like esterase
LQHPLLGRTTQVIAVMLGVLAVPYAHPAMRRLRVIHAPWDKDSDVAILSAAPSASIGDQALPASLNQATVTNALPEEPDRTPLDPAVLAKTVGSLAIEDPAGTALDAFYKRLGRTLKKEPGAITRVLHYGDSVIASDYVSGTMRRRMQQKFGDAGHGFILTANAWEWYFHNDVAHKASEGWLTNKITGPWTKDGFYGLGGVSFHTQQLTTATFGTTKSGDYGRKVSRFDIYYLEQPDGGDFQIEIKGKDPERVSTRGTDKVSKKKSVTVDDGESEMTLRTMGGEVRMFGVVMEREGPGVAYDALGALAGRASLWEQQDATHWKDQMALRDPALVIVQYGTNESEDGGINEPQYQKFLGNLLDKLKQAAPDASILVAAPPDRATNVDGKLGTVKVIPRLVYFQRKVAGEKGVAFWDTFKAMGGEGSMAKWYEKGLCSGDFTHPTPAGATLLGDLMFKSILTGYQAYASTHKDVPMLEDPDAGP